MLKLIAEKARRPNKKVYNCFVDFKKAFDSVDQEISWATLQSYGVDEKLVELLRDINGTSQAAVRMDGELGQWFRTNRGTRQGDPISPTVFIADLGRPMDKIRERDSGIAIHGIRINNLRFADDVDLLAEDKKELGHSLEILNAQAKKFGLAINIKKTKTVIFGVKTSDPIVKVEGIQIENVESFTYLGSNFTFDLDGETEVKTRLARAYTALKSMDKIWKSSTIKLTTKMRSSTPRSSAQRFTAARHGCTRPR
jgi:hypothetical protein